MTYDHWKTTNPADAELGSIRQVYPLYFASRVQRGLRTAMDDAEKIIADVGTIECLGNSRYAITALDENGTEYRITVEVAP